MPPKILALIGVGLALLAVTLSWGTAHWLDARTFKPVDTSVLLEAGRVQTIRFATNLRKVYEVSLLVDYSPDDWTEGKCNSDRLAGKTWKMFRVSSLGARSRWASKEFAQRERYRCKLVPGTYELEWAVPESAGCLSPRHPRLEIATDSSSYREAVDAMQYVSVFMGGTGLMLIVLAVKWHFTTVFGARPLRIFPEMKLRNVVPLQRHRPMALFSAPLDFGIAWGSVLMVVAFIFYRGLLMHPPAQGLRISFSKGKVAQAFESPWKESLGVYIDRRGRFLVNGQVVEHESLPVKLQEELGKRMVWTVYFEADNASLFRETAYAIDKIQGLGAKVTWITPKMRDEWRAAAGWPSPETAAP
jgi:biopolymer transport protein ExbD